MENETKPEGQEGAPGNAPDAPAGQKPNATPPDERAQKAQSKGGQRGGGQRQQGRNQPPDERAQKAPPARRVPLTTSRPGLVELEAVKTCAAHGMPHHEGERFFADRPVAERLVAKGAAKRV